MINDILDEASSFCPECGLFKCACTYCMGCFASPCNIYTECVKQHCISECGKCIYCMNNEEAVNLTESILYVVPDDSIAIIHKLE